MDSAPTASLGGTFGGNPVVCAAALESIREIQKAMRNVPRIHAILTKRLSALANGFESVGDVRGLGAMHAIEFVKDRRSKEPDTEWPRTVQMEALRRGLILITTGFHNNCIRFLPPLNIPTPLLERSMDLFEEALAAAVTA
jgi:4-aminobutyrate aminotransferase/(S)-3-amino-2-methylpropionate transaminase